MALVTRALTILRQPAMRGMIGIAVLKVAMIAFNFGLIALATRALGEHDFGVYSMLFSSAGLFCVIATFGQSMLIVRSWNEYSAAGDMSQLKGALIYTAITSGLGSALVAAGFLGWLDMQYDWALALSVTAYMVLQGVLWNTSHLVRASVGVGTGDGTGNLFVPAPVLAYLPYALYTGQTVTVAQVFTLLALGAGAAILLHLVIMPGVIRRRFGDRFRRARTVMDGAQWTTRSFKLWLSSGLETANQYLDVIIIGYLLSPTLAGVYFVVTRLANAFAAASDAINLFATRHIPDLYYRGDRKGLDTVLNTIALTTAAVVAAGLIGIVALGYWILVLISPAYGEHYPALVLLCVGTAALAGAGPSASLLMLTGHEGRYLVVLGATVILRAIGFLALTPSFGILGAVSATTISFVLLGIALRHSTRTLAGIDTSLLRLFSAAPEPLQPAVAK